MTEEPKTTPEEPTEAPKGPPPLRAILHHIQSMSMDLAKMLHENTRRVGEILMVERLHLQMLARDRVFPVDLGQFQKVSGVAMHPHAWGCIINDPKAEPEEEFYKGEIMRWAEYMNIRVEFSGEFKVTSHDAEVNRMREMVKKQKEGERGKEAEGK